MNKLDAFIFAMYGAASDLHYVALMENNWAAHLKGDRLRDGLLDWRDKIQEVHCIPMEDFFITAKDSFNDTSEILKYESPKTVKDAEDKLYKIISDTLVYIKTLENKLPIGTLNMVQGFAQDLQQKIAFLNKME